MRNKTFHDHDHAYRYLTSSVIRLGEEPIYVMDIGVKKDGRFSIVYKTVGRVEANKSIAIDDERVNMNPVSLGYMNVKEPFTNNCDVRVAFRRPYRGWKIGLCYDNLMLFTQNHNQISGMDRLYNDVFNAGFLRDTIMGKYPSYRQALNLAENGVPCAFSRRFSFNKDARLCFNQLVKPVGRLDRNRQVKLDDGYEYLAQILTEDMSK